MHPRTTTPCQANALCSLEMPLLPPTLAFFSSSLEDQEEVQLTRSLMHRPTSIVTIRSELLLPPGIPASSTVAIFDPLLELRGVFFMVVCTFTAMVFAASGVSRLLYFFFAMEFAVQDAAANCG